MLSDLLDAFSNLVYLLPNGNKNNSPKEKESETSIVLAIIFTVASAVMLFFNRQIFASENITLILLVIISISLFSAAVLLIFSIKFDVIKPLQVKNFAVLFLSITCLLASTLMLLNDHLKII